MLMYYQYTALFRAFPPCPRVLIEFLEVPICRVGDKLSSTERSLLRIHAPATFGLPAQHSVQVVHEHFERISNAAIVALADF